jgi:HD-like signal output (HDOD) protein
VGQLSGELKQEDRKGLLARIPAFPPIVLRLLDVLSSDDVEIRELVSLVSSDPAFSAQILQVANSPLFGFRSQIDSVQSALVVLGLRRVRALTMTVATANHMKAVLKIEELSRCWRHMLACALLTEELARSCSKFEERAYTAGLLHDVGRLGLLLAHPTEYAELLRNATRNALELLDCEKNVLGMDHCEAGRLLAAQWNLPAELQIVAARHHDPQTGRQLGLLGRRAAQARHGRGNPGRSAAITQKPHPYR